MSNPANFNFDLTRSPTEGYDELTADEKLLIALYPVQAAVIRDNVNDAFAMSDFIFQPTFTGLNDKKDAFRHAFFQAINTRDVPPRLHPVPASASQIVRMFANAHESEVPEILQLEKQMDLFNNEVGIQYCGNCFTTSNQSIADALFMKLLNGELKYLSPLDPSRGLYDLNRDKIQDCSTCTNGITPGVTALKNTNE